MLKRSILIILALLCIPALALAAGFTSDVAGINEAAKSVLMLEVYQDDIAIGTGSGFVVENNRTLITNYHVMEGADMIVGYSDDGYSYIINKVYAVDEARDLAVLGFFSPTNLTPLKLNTGDILRAEPVVAIGSPQGLLNTVSMGNVSAVFTANDTDQIQFTAPISSGSSGGALFNDRGEVIGVTTSALMPNDNVVQNLNFAVNATEILKLLETVDETKAVSLEEYDSGVNPNETPAPTTEPTLDPTNGIHNVKMVYNWDGTATFSWYDDTNQGKTIYWICCRSSSKKTDWIEMVETTPTDDGYLSISLPISVIYQDRIFFSISYTSEDATASLNTGTVLQNVSSYTVVPTMRNLVPYDTIRIKQGYDKKTIKNIQNHLIKLGYLQDTADGIYGTKTASALEMFCLENHLVWQPDIILPTTQFILYKCTLQH